MEKHEVISNLKEVADRLDTLAAQILPNQPALLLAVKTAIEMIENPWKPMDQAPLTGRILLKYADGQVIGGQWCDDSHAKQVRPYWTNDFEHFRGRLYTRDVQPTGWMHFPDGKS